jgi:hypothetical protein
MSNYNFDDLQGEQPIVKMGGYEYRLRYPTVAEIENLNELKTDKEKTDAVYAFVERTGDGVPDFKEVLRQQDIRVLREFNRMIKTEFGIDE